MRILFTFVGGLGHFEPLRPLARVSRDAGHEVAFACAPAMAPAVERAGFAALPLGEAGARPAERLPLRPVDRAREERALRERFVRRAATERVPLVLDCATSWRADVFVCDETDFGSVVAAERLGVPHATVLVMAAGGFVRPDVVAEPLDALRAEHGLPPDPGLDVPPRYLALAPFPPSFRDPADPLPPTARVFRPSWDGAATDWSPRHPERPLVYLTLGTIFNVESGDLLSRCVAGLQELPIELVATVGPGIDPAELGPRPDHVHVARHLPQAALLPHCAAVVSHGGAGSVLGALSHGLPSVLIPLGADQPWNADRCTALGVATVLEATAATADVVRDAVAELLSDAGRRSRAEGLRDEIAALPEPAAMVPALEALLGSSPA